MRKGADFVANDYELDGDPAKRAFYRAFRDLNTLNDLGIE
jgi:hypothetical protein